MGDSRLRTEGIHRQPYRRANTGLSWSHGRDAGGMAQLAGLTLWGLFVIGKLLLLEYRRAPWIVHRIEIAALAAGVGGIVFLAMFLTLRADQRAVRRGEGGLAAQRTPILLVLFVIAVAFITDSTAECLLLAWGVLLTWAIGRIAGRNGERAKEGSKLAECTVSVGIGLGLVVLIFTLLGFAGWFYRGVVYAVVAGLTLLLLRPIYAIIGELRDAWRAPRRATHPEPDGFLVAGISLLGALIAMSSVPALAPETGYDALTYHLAASKIFAEHHRIVEIPQMTPSYWPANGVVLYTFAQLIAGPKLVKLLNFGFGLLLVAMTYVLGTRYFDAGVGTRAALILVSLPLVLWEFGTAYTDLPFSFFCLLGIWLFLDACRPSTRSDHYGMTLAGLAFGVALGFKPVALVIMAPLAGALLIWAVRRGGRSPRQAAVSLLTLFGVSALFSIHWYVRSYVYTGNPIFPFLNSLFRSPYWTGPDLVNLSRFGMGTQPLDLLMLPWNVTFHPQRFVEVGNLGVISLMFLPLLPYAKSMGGSRSWLLVVSLTFLPFWILTGQYARYLLPVLPLVSLVYSGAIVQFCRERLGSRRLPTWVIHAILIAGVLQQVLLWFPLDDTRFPYGVVSGRESSADYLARVHPVSRVWAYANEHLDKDALLLTAGNEFTYFSDRLVVPYGWLSAVFTGRFPKCFIDLGAESLIYRSLLRCGYTHVLIDHSNAHFKSRRFGQAVLPGDSFYTTYLQEEYAHGEVYLYKVRRL